MVERWRSENLGQEPDDKIIDTLRVQAQMIVDDISRSQYLEEMEFFIPATARPAGRIAFGFRNPDNQRRRVTLGPAAVQFPR